MTRPLFFILIFTGMILLTNPAIAEVPFNESIAGDRNLGQNFTWTAYNVSMNADSTYHYTVYDYRDIGEEYHYFSVNWAQWFVESPGPGMKFYAVWIRGWMEGTAWHGWGADRFRLWVGNKSYAADPVKMQDLPLRNIGKPIETAVTSCGQVEPVETSPGYSKPVSTGRYLPVVIRELENRMSRYERGLLTTERYGWKDENEMIRMDPGISNAYDGLLIFRVPEDSRPENMSVSGSFWSWGTAFWHLTNTTIDQESVERYQLVESAMMEMERESGIRLPDKEPARTEA